VMPVHRVVMRETGLNEIYVDTEGDALVLREGSLSNPAIAAQLSACGAMPGGGAFADVSLAAVDWVRDAAKRLSRGFILLIDRGHEAAHLYGPEGSQGTLACRPRPLSESLSGTTPWLERPGEQEITADVDFTSARAAAEAEGCVSLGSIDQTHFLMALAGPRVEGFDAAERQAFNTLVLPGGAGSRTKVLVLAKGVGTPVLRCRPGAIGTA
jgi:SAM-dependent MidA family methyltransferase